MKQPPWNRAEDAIANIGFKMTLATAESTTDIQVALMVDEKNNKREVISGQGSLFGNLLGEGG